MRWDSFFLVAHVVTAPDWADVLARGPFCQYIYLTAWLSCIEIERFRMIQISWKWWDCIAHTQPRSFKIMACSLAMERVDFWSVCLSCVCESHFNDLNHFVASSRLFWLILNGSWNQQSASKPWDRNCLDLGPTWKCQKFRRGFPEYPYFSGAWDAKLSLGLRNSQHGLKEPWIAVTPWHLMP